MLKLETVKSEEEERTNALSQQHLMCMEVLQSYQPGERDPRDFQPFWVAPQRHSVPFLLLDCGKLSE